MTKLNLTTARQRDADNDLESYRVLSEGPHDDSRDSRPTAETVQKINAARKRNRTLMMYHTLLSTITFSIIQWNVFDAYLSFLAKSKGFTYVNSTVGVAESVNGITSLILAIPVGLMVDYYSRTKALKWSAVLGIFASALSAYSFAADAIVPLYANLFLWGVYGQITGSASEAIFADSIPTGERAQYFTKKGVLERVGLSLGPAIMIGLFCYFGNNWELRGLHVPLLVGCAMAPLPCLLQWLFEDPRPDLPFVTDHGASSLCAPSTVNAFLTSPITNREQLTTASPVLKTIQLSTDESEDSWYDHLTLTETMIPYLVAASDFVRKVGAGMTIKFFPLFFINDYGFRPVHINLLFCIYPLGMGFATMSLQAVHKPLGRAQAAIIYQLSGICFLVGMYFVQNMQLMILFFVLRGSFQNASYPLDKSIIMDYIPSRHRGIWNAVESVTSMTWSGSALIGGMLSDVHDYRYTFLFTASIYLVASVVYLPLLWMVPRSESEIMQRRRQQTVRRKIVPNLPTARKDVLRNKVGVTGLDVPHHHLKDEKDQPLLKDS